MTDKSERVFNFHKNTMKALADLIGACGFKTPDELTPDIFFKRTEQNLNQSFSELYFGRIKKYREPYFFRN